MVPRLSEPRTRAPAFAGVLYPAEPGDLRAALAALLDRAPSAARRPKALLVPHGALPYSGSVAARAYGTLRAPAPLTSRVVLAGPLHRGGFEGLAVPDADAFATPLGTLPLDPAARRTLLSLPWVRRTDVPHAREHALEVQLPFLQATLPACALVPVLVGRARAAQIETALARVWGGPETLVVVTADLSRHRPYADAQRQDRATAARIVAGHAAVGATATCAVELVDVLLALARRHGLTASALDLANSGDAGGDATRVVGYGAFAFW